MRERALYAKIVEWPEEDYCFLGSVPGLLYGGCHGPDEKEVFAQLHQDGKALPPPTAGRDFANTLQ